MNFDCCLKLVYFLNLKGVSMISIISILEILIILTFLIFYIAITVASKLILSKSIYLLGPKQ